MEVDKVDGGGSGKTKRWFHIGFFDGVFRFWSHFTLIWYGFHRREGENLEENRNDG